MTMGREQLGELFIPITADVEGLNRQLQGAHRSIVNVGKQISAAMLAIGAAGVGAFSVAAKSAMSFDQNMREVRTLLGEITDTEFADLKQATLDFSSAVGVDATDSVNALYQAISAGVPQDNVFDFMEVASMAAIGGVTDLKTAVDGLTTIINAWGMDISEAERVADVLFSTVKNGKTTMEELSGSFFIAAPLASAMGVSLEEVAAATSTLTKSGVPTSIAMTQVRSALVALSNPGTELTQILEDLGFSSGEAAIEALGFQGSLDAVRQAADAAGTPLSTVFGRVEAVSGVLGLTGENAGIFAADFEDAMNAGGDAAEAFGIMNEGAGRKVAIATTQLKNMVIEIGDVFLPLIADAAVKVMAFLAPLRDWIKANPELAKTITLVAAGISALLLVLGTLGLAVLMLTPAITLLSGIMMKALIPAIIATGRALMTLFLNPVGLVILAIAAIIAGIVLLVIHWDKIWPALQKSWEAFWTFISKAWITFTSWIGKTWEGIKTAVTDKWDEIWEAARIRWNTFVTGIGIAWAQFKTDVGTVWEGIKATLIEKWDETWAALGEAWDTFVSNLQWVKGLADALVESFNKGNFDDLHNAIRDWIIRALAAGWAKVTETWDAVTTWLSDFSNKLKEAWDNASILDVAAAIGRFVTDAVVAGMKLIPGVGAAFAIADGVKNIIGFIRGETEAAESEVEEVGRPIGEAFGRGVQEGIRPEVVEGFGRSAGEALGRGMQEGIREVTPDIIDEQQNMQSEVERQAEHDASKNFIDGISYGGAIPGGMSAGIGSGSTDLLIPALVALGAQTAAELAKQEAPLQGASQRLGAVIPAGFFAGLSGGRIVAGAAGIAEAALRAADAASNHPVAIINRMIIDMRSALDEGQQSLTAAAQQLAEGITRVLVEGFGPVVIAAWQNTWAQLHVGAMEATSAIQALQEAWLTTSLASLQDAIAQKLVIWQTFWAQMVVIVQAGSVQVAAVLVAWSTQILTILTALVTTVQAQWTTFWAQMAALAQSAAALLIALVQAMGAQLISIIQSAMATVQSIWQSAWSSMVSTTQSAASAIISAANNMANAVEAAARRVQAALASARAAAASMPSGGGSIQGRQHGGPVFAGQPYIVGEGGPEMFIPNVSGHIFSNRDSQDMLGGGATYIYNITAPTPMSPQEVRRQIERQDRLRALVGSG